MGIGGDGDGTAPVETGLTYPTLGDCYRAEDAIAAETTNYINGWLKAAKAKVTNGLPDFMQQRAYRSICVPRR